MLPSLIGEGLTKAQKKASRVNITDRQEDKQ